MHLSALELGVPVVVVLEKHSTTKEWTSIQRLIQEFLFINPFGTLACICVLTISLAPSVNINLRLAYKIVNSK
jgi:hypothetical protein